MKYVVEGYSVSEWNAIYMLQVGGWVFEWVSGWVFEGVGECLSGWVGV